MLVSIGVKINLQLYRRIVGIPSGPIITELDFKLEIILKISCSVRKKEFKLKLELFEFKWG